MSRPTIARSATRNIDLDQLAKILHEESAHKLDVVAGAGAIRAAGGRLVVDDTEPVLAPDGVTMTAGSYHVNDVANTGRRGAGADGVGEFRPQRARILPEPDA